MTTLALLMGGIVATAPVARAAAPKTAHDLPPLKSDPAPKVTPQLLPGDFSNAPPNPSQADPASAPARASGYDPDHSVPVDAQTTPTQKMVTNRDGSRTAIVSPTPVRFQDATGWHDIDLTLVPATGGVLGARSSQGTATLGATAAGIVASFTTTAGTIGLRHAAAAAVPASLNNATATYKAALGGRDLVLGLRTDGFEETVVAPDAKSSGTFLDEYVLPAGVSARDGVAGVEFVDAKGTVVATISNGVALDSAPGAKRAASAVTVRVVPNAPAPPATTPTTTSTATPSTTVPSTTSTTVGASSTTTAVPATTSTTAAPTTSTTVPAKATENVATVEASVSSAWFSDPARVFPIALDPTVTVATNASNAYGIDTFAYAAAPTTNYGTASALYSGNISGKSESFIKFNNLVVTPGPDMWVTESHLMLLGGAANDCSKPVDVQGIDGTLSAATVWANKPATTGSVVSTTTLGAGCGSIWNTFDTTTLARSWITSGAPNYGLRVSATDESDPAAFKWFWSGNTANPPLLYITYDHLPGYSTPVAPVTTSVVPTATPTLAAATTTDSDGDAVQYWFRATPAPDAESGAKMVDSGWLSTTPTGTPCAPTGQICYTAPAGALTDGVIYYWHVWTRDPTMWRLPTGTPSSFRIDLGLGDKGAQPRDAIGPASVNLASGNAVVRTASPSFSTPGGSVGLAYAYNSQAPPAAGLTGSYFLDPGTHLFPAQSAVKMVRTDPTIDHYWGTAGPGLGIPATGFMVRWTGLLTVPTTGSYTFAADHDDGVKIVVNATAVLTHWSDGAYQSPSEAGAPITLTGGAAVPIEVDYYQNTGAAFATISVVSPGTTIPTQLPPTWLTPDAAITSPVLSAGWTLAPGQLSYGAAVLGDRWVGFVDTSGAMHTYTWTGSGYAPPLGDDGVVGTDTSGALTLHATDGLDYAFDSAGRLVSATSAADDGGFVSSLSYSWSGTKPRLTTITDPATGRAIHLHYGGGTCPTLAGFDPAPADALCQVDYWDNVSFTKLYYVIPVPGTPAQLARIEDPGGAVTDFAYSGGHLVSVRTPLAADAVAVPGTTGRTDDATVRTALAYDTAPTPRVTSVTLPAPLAGAARPAHSYTYTSATETQVSVAGLTQPRGYASDVTLVRNATNGLTLGGTDADGIALPIAVYDNGDRLVSSTDAAGRLSTVTYDDDATRAQATGRATNTYGPAPASCFTANVPNGSCTGANAPPHTATSYDTDAASGAPITGLAATYWPDVTLGTIVAPGDPAKDHGRATPDTTHASVLTPLNEATGALGAVDPPAAGLASGNWSARYTGEVTLDQTGAYSFATVLTGRARLYVDDTLVVDDGWADHASSATVSGTFTNNLVGRHRIRVDYATHATGAASLALHWTLPSGGGDTAIPAAKLAPRYSAPTASVTDDSGGISAQTNDVHYATMANGLPTTATASRVGANLVSTTSYENPASGHFLRPVTSSLPAAAAGGGTTTTYAYYAGEAAVTPCAGAASSQALALKSTTGATPASGAALVHTFAYDAAGRVIGSATAGDWTCTAYDTRGRVTSVGVPAYGGQPAHTFAYNYAVGTPPNANPLINTISDGGNVITTNLDLLGRTVSYTDVWGKTTTTTYDQPGRATDTSGPAGATHVGYTPASRVSTQSLDGAAMATATYSSTTGELASVSYASAVNGGNGTSLASITRSPAGLTTGLSWTLPGGGALATDAVTRSQSGRVTDETIDGTDADPANPNFTYDPVGRLASARVTKGGVLHTYTYSFAPVATCTAPAAADPGRNSNRTSVTDNGGTPTTYCYDNADRLLSSTDPTVGSPVYDSHGNTTTLGTQNLVYDGAGRHMATTDGATTVTYLRDATGRITSRTEGTAAAVHYGFAGPGDSASFTMDAANNVTERTIGLVGGVMVTKRGGLLGAGDVWSYPNVHGDVMAVADNNGVKQGATMTYDPNGTALGALPDNSAGNFDYGWLGSNQRPIEHAGSLATIEMGARPYVPSLGRFLQVDPVSGGSCNDYDYVCGDPVNGRDTSGLQFDNTNVLLFLADPLPSSDDMSVFSSTFLHIHAITTTPVRFSGSVKVQRRQGGKWVDTDTSTQINSEVFPGEVGDDFLPIQIPLVQSGRFRVHVNLYIKNLDTGHTVHFIQDGIIVCQDYRCRREGGNIGT